MRSCTGKYVFDIFSSSSLDGLMIVSTPGNCVRLLRLEGFIVIARRLCNSGYMGIVKNVMSPFKVRIVMFLSVVRSEVLNM